MKFSKYIRLGLFCLIILLITGILHYLIATSLVGLSYSTIIVFIVYLLFYWIWIDKTQSFFKSYIPPILFWIFLCIYCLFASPKALEMLLPSIVSISLSFSIVYVYKVRNKRISFLIAIISGAAIIFYSFFIVPRVEFNKRIFKTSNVYKSTVFNKDRVYFMNVNGDKVHLDTLNKKVVYIEFWFLECSPCLLKMPVIKELKDRYKYEKNVVFVSVINGHANTYEEFRNSYAMYGSHFNLYLYAPKQSMTNIRNTINFNGYPIELIFYENLLKSAHNGFISAEKGYYLNERIKFINNLMKL